MVGLVYFFLLNGFVFGAAALVARFGLRLRERFDCGLATVVLAWVYVIVGLEFLSLMDLIRLPAALVMSFVAILAGAACWWVDRTRVANAKFQDELIRDGMRPGSELLRAQEHEPAVARLSFMGRAVPWSFGLLLVMAAWSAADYLVRGLCSPVLPVSDAPIYHLYFAIRWWKEATLSIVPTPFGESAAPYFPANGDVWLTWLLLPLESETAAKVGQWPFLIVGMAGVFALARELGVRSQSALVPAVLWGTGTMQLLHSSFADVDLIMAAFYLMATWFLIRYGRQGNVADLTCGALAMGAVLGTKYVAIPFVFWLIAAAGWFAWRHSHRRVHLSVLLLAVLVPSVYWYGRNILISGNPLFPLHTELFGRVLFPGWYTRATMLQSDDYHIPVFPFWEQTRVLVQIVVRAIDPILMPLWLGGVAAAVGSAARKLWLPILLVGLALIHIVLFWWVNPYQTQDRFLFAALGLLAVPAALVVERRPMVSVFVAALVFWHLLLPQVNLGVSSFPPSPGAPMNLNWSLSMASGLDAISLRRIVLLVALCMAASLCGWWRGTASRRFAIAVALVGVLAAGGALAVRWSWIVDPRLRFYALWPQLNYTLGWVQLESASGSHARVAYAGTNLPYYLFGMQLQNDVRYVNINSHAGFRLHDYHAASVARGESLSSTPTPDWDRREADEYAWIENLRRAEIDLLFIGHTNRSGGLHNIHDAEGFPIERTWADRHPEIFSLLHADSRTRLYELKISE